MKKTFLRKTALPEDMSLQITSMADIFMILLVFLLKSYSTSVINIAPTNEVRLPLAHTQGNIRDTLKLEISAGAIVVDQTPIVSLKNFEFAPETLDDKGSSTKLSQVLAQQRKKLPVPNMDSNLLVLADERTPYSTIKTILGSAAGAGFVDLQLVVVQPD